ncbi:MULTISPECIES: ferrochelatase [unclassified Kocuria]|uniref:ferrochelatase n=1 Tax=unclassified Kocuria TaxID=2649579 RepID=UPI0006498F27|nr:MULTISPECIES: ferrochelatase [unclassified Kocuria]KLU09734.1 ferrochelatase [Kocuria sp. SM24M-10]OLT05239.1 ferrochelatase [Kocuria sp. CNJ-770]
MTAENDLSRARAHPPEDYDAVILSSFGGPEGQDDVLPFLRNVTKGRGIPDERLEEVATHYRANGGVSPINAQNRALRSALEAELLGRGMHVPVLWANRNWAPYVADVVRECHARGMRRLLVLATSAYSSYSGCRQYREDYGVALEELGLRDEMHIDKVHQYYDSEGFVQPFVEGLRDGLAQVRERLGAEGGRIAILFCTHSIPTTDAEASGPARMDFEENSAYVAQHLAVARTVLERVGPEELGDHTWDLVYQSRSGPPQVPWLEPDVNDALEEVAGRGVAGAVLVPLGFVSDHMEVKWDLDTEALETCERLGLPAVRTPTAGTHPAFVSGLADLVEQRVAGRAAPPRVSACAQGTWFDDCAPDCCVKVLRGAAGPRPTIAQRPEGDPIPVDLDESGEVRYA